MSTIHTNKNRLSSAVLSLFIPVSILASLSLGIALTREGRPVSQNNPEKLRIGVFPVRRLARESDRFLESLGRALRTDLGASGMAEIVPLAWPEELAGSDGPTFETLVNRGKEKGCNGVLALHLQAMSFTTKVVDVPIVGKSTLAEAAFGLSGGLIDVTSGAAVSPVKAESTKRNPRYRGPDANAALASDFGTPYFNDSLLGQAGKEAVRQAVEAVRNGLSGLTPGPIGLPRRAAVPGGVGFGQDAFSMKMAAGYDHRGAASVVNRGPRPQTFVIAALDVPGELFVGLLGEGSADSPCTLGPGQWKEVRFVANALRKNQVQAVKLGLFVVPPGGKPPLPAAPDDQAMMNLEWEAPGEAVAWAVLGQDPVTLAYTCQLKNRSDRDIWDASVRPTREHAGFVLINPLMESVRIPANGTVTFQVVPRLSLGVRAMDVTLMTSPGGDRRELHFAVPKGKRVYMGLGHTTESSSSAGSGCSNQENLELDASGAPCAYHSCFKEQMGLRLSIWWYWLVTHMPGYEEPGPDQRGRMADVRGATIRPSVSARLPNMDTDSTSHPMASAGKDCRGLAYYTAGPDKSTSVFFVAERPSDGQVWKFDDPVQMNEPGHNARWPYIRTRWSTSQAFLVWEDAGPGKRSDVAFRASGDRMRSWNPVQYLTGHGRGVDDPVVHMDDQGGVGIAWSDLRDGSSQIYFRISRDGGATFAPEQTIPRSPGESQAWPQFAFAPRTGFKLVYVSKGGEETRIVSRDLDDQGIPRGATSVLSHPGASCGEPQVAWDQAGRSYAVWREGEGSGSEVWFSRLPADGSAWTSPKALTRDSVYSEYPLIGVEGETLFASYHTEALGAMDLKYVLASEDGGETWRESIAQPSLERNAVGRAFVEVRFTLQNPRSTYPPFDTAVFLNDVRIGEIKRAVPEGTYVWEAPADIVRCGAQSLDVNQISMKFGNLSGGHYILAADSRLIVQRRYTQVPVVAASQAEADALADRSGSGLNHSAPDLALAANSTAPLPAILVPGQKIDLRLQVFNLGEGAASDVRISIFGSDPRDSAANPDPGKLAEVRVGTVGPGEVKTADVEFTYDPARVPRIFASVSAREKDFFAADNTWGFALTKGESDRVSPLFGTDIPDVLRAPGLLNIVSVPNMRGLVDMASLPGLEKLVGKSGLKLPDMGEFTNTLRDKLKRLDWKDVDLNRLFKR